MGAGRELVWLAALTNASLIQHFTESLSGSITIRSFDQEAINTYSQPAFHYSVAREWLDAIRGENSTIHTYSQLALYAFEALILWREANAISEKVGNFIHYLPTFLAGLVVGFISTWKLALLSVAVIPGITFAGGSYTYTLTGLTSKSRESYANAGIIAKQAIAQVRRVYSYVGETRELKSYYDVMQNTLKLGYKDGMAKELGIGCTYGIACMSWALVFWYAGVFIRNGQTDGGKAFTAIFSAIVGGMSLGQNELPLSHKMGG
ncbi:hypothetical protein IFM89_024575 [Coptis chinensis]|uniref:ABC transmembrane type-1 domain-containing protein n=1 Tax=Coptis chinensis TaxID=261450 RepID=A0A835I327_9MAGN|nr:hypothetical protein IFM89_024575 [Coptis chinensis]